MKKLVSFLAMTVIAMPAMAAAPSHITRDGRGGYNVTYNYKDKAQSGWYVGARAELSFLNWKNKYSSDASTVNGDLDSEEFSFKPVFGGSVFAGRTIKYFWRAEVEAGYLGHFSDKDQGFEFSLSVPYLMANGYYDFTDGLYVGAGLGVAMPTTKLDDAEFKSGHRDKMSASLMGGVMLGYARKLDDNLVLDLRYRLAGLNGTTHKRTFVDGTEIGGVDVSGAYFKNKIGLILDNSISLGIRYTF